MRLDVLRAAVLLLRLAVLLLRLAVGLTVRRLGRPVLGRRLGRAVLRRGGAVLGLTVKLVGSRGWAEHPAAFEIMHEELEVGEELCAWGIGDGERSGRVRGQRKARLAATSGRPPGAIRQTDFDLAEGELRGIIVDAPSKVMR